MNIFVTIGTQEPFDRLIKIMDSIAPKLEGAEIIAQVAEAMYKPDHIRVFKYLVASDFDYYFTKAELVVSHAGMGTVISALVKGKPIIIFPRLAKLGEHRSDHQFATAQKLEELNYVHVAYDHYQLEEKISGIIKGDLKALYTLGEYASNELLSSIKSSLYN